MAETSGIINGTTMAVYVDDVKVAVATASSISINMPTRETSNKDTSIWVTRLPNRGSFTISGSSYFQFEDSETDGFSMLMTAMIARTTVTVMVSSETADNRYYTGSAYLETLDADFPDDENSTYTYMFNGTGAITEYENT